MSASRRALDIDATSSPTLGSHRCARSPTTLCDRTRDFAHSLQHSYSCAITGGTVWHFGQKRSHVVEELRTFNCIGLTTAVPSNGLPFGLMLVYGVQVHAAES